MAKIVVAGDAVVVTSSMKLEDLRTIAKYRPEALVLKGGEDGKEPIFSIAVTNGTGSVNKYGASFGSETNNEEKLASVTMVAMNRVDGNVREAIADQFGCAITNLNKLEEILPGVLAEIKAEKAAVMGNISVVQ